MYPKVGLNNPEPGSNKNAGTNQISAKSERNPGTQKCSLE
jgi:hypothetical protein